MVRLKKGDRLFYARILPTVRIYDVCEVIVRTVRDTYFVGVDKREKRAYLFNFDDIDTILFQNRNIALEKVHTAENNALKGKCEIDYEEY